MHRESSLFCGVILAAAATLPALAQDALPAAVDAALAEAEARAEPDQRWAFTRTVRTPEASLTARFDPSLPEDAQWTLIEPASEAALSDEQDDLLEDLRGEPVPDRLLMIEGPADNYGLRLYVARGTARDESGPEGYYRFTPRNDVGLTFPPFGSPTPDEARGQLILAGGLPVRVRLYAEEPFKPNIAARIDQLDIFWDLGEVEPGGPIAIVRADTRLLGSAAFSRIANESSTINTGFERVDIR